LKKLLLPLPRAPPCAPLLSTASTTWFVTTTATSCRWAYSFSSAQPQGRPAL
jgi:hypothetical protein